MGELVNLNKVRKARDKAEARSRAEIKRVTHGRSRADKALAKIERERAERRLDGARRETPED